MMTSQPVASSLSFIHIPKNAGTSVKQAIADHHLPIRTSGHAYPTKLTNEEIAVIRDPVERFVSAFNYSQQYYPSPVNRQFADANELAECAYNSAHPKHGLALDELGNQPEHYLRRSGQRQPPHTVAGRVLDFAFAYEPQASWLFNQPAYLLRFRHLKSDFQKLLETLGLQQSADLLLLNSSTGPCPFLSNAARAFIEHTYAADYQFIRARDLNV